MKNILMNLTLCKTTSNNRGDFLNDYMINIIFENIHSKQ